MTITAIDDNRLGSRERVFGPPPPLPLQKMRWKKNIVGHFAGVWWAISRVAQWVTCWRTLSGLAVSLLDTYWGIVWVTFVSAGDGAPRAVGRLVGNVVAHLVGLEWVTLWARAFPLQAQSNL